MYDKMLNSEVSMQLNDRMSTGKVARQSLGPDGRTTGSYDNNPNEHFFMDTFFVNGKPSTRGYTCCQIFVTKKGFLYVVPMKSKSEVLQAVKQFAK